MSPVNHLNLLPDKLSAEWTTGTERPPRLATHTISADLANGGGRRIAVLDAEGGETARWYSRAQPGCSAVVVTSGMRLDPKHRGKGLGKWLRDYRERTYAAAGFAAELCTVRTDNIPQNRIMGRRGRVVGEFPSDNGGGVRLYYTDLTVRA